MAFDFDAIKAGFASLKRPVYYLPFVCLILVKFLWYAVLFYSVQGPFKALFNPIIIKFWGAPYVHYPSHLIWMDAVIKQTEPFFDIILGSIALWFFFKIISKDYEMAISIKKIRQKLFVILLFILTNIFFKQAAIFTGALLNKFALARFFRILNITGYSAMFSSLYMMVFVTAIFYGLSLLIYPYLILGRQGVWKNLFMGFLASVKTIGTTFVPLLFVLAALLTIELPIMVPNFFGPLVPPDVLIITRVIVDILLAPVNVFIMSMTFYLVREQSQ